GDAALNTWNPSSTLTTAREIITLWVSRMVMFNVYFRDCLPFGDVFIHAMIQDGHGQKMSKSLGNGVDPTDIIHSHGCDAMRFTLTSMTTQTQDVRMPVDLVDPHSGETFEPAFVTTDSGYQVAAPIQEHNGKKMVSSYGLASGQASPTDEMPLARNTSPKFDLGRNFANKLWNAVRFALERLSDEPEVDLAEADGELGLADRWLLSRLVRAVENADRALADYDFNGYADGLYDFFRRDLCDWYIEAIKPTVKNSKVQRQLLAAALDVSLRLLHPVMPFITEALWEHLNRVAPDRDHSGGVAGLEAVAIPASDLLVNAPWPKVDAGATDEAAEKAFAVVREAVSAIREVRTANQVVPRETVEVSIRAGGDRAAILEEAADLVGTLAGAKLVAVGESVERPDAAAGTAMGEAEVFVHDVIDADAERERLERRIEEVDNDISTLEGRLANEGYVNNAPAHLVEETRGQLEESRNELAALQSQLEAL
ncbi:MAG: class I tRNA ligase family protein, partial [Phycisphaeraceae bacterium]|nr:class I tRNA ligase family protein [Phycisphaeraceae bacterium]